VLDEQTQISERNDSDDVQRRSSVQLNFAAVLTKQKHISKKDVDTSHLVEAVECTAM
jgi:hypothetical protein